MLMFISYRNQSIDLQRISFDWFLYNIDPSWLMAFSYFSMSTSLFFSLILVSQLGRSFLQKKYLNVDCGLHLQFVVLDKDYKYLQHVVKLPRCSGRSTKIKEKKCLPVETEAQQYQFTEKSDFKKHTLDLLNHVKCDEICTINSTSCNEYQKFDHQSCRCQCKYNSDPEICKAPFIWNSSQCSCSCPLLPEYHQCSGRKVYNGNTCGCTCHKKYARKCSKVNKYLDPRTCYCKEIQTMNKKVSHTCKTGIPNLIVAIALILELTVFIAISYLINTFLWRFSDKINGGSKKSMSPFVYQNYGSFEGSNEGNAC